MAAPAFGAGPPPPVDEASPVWDTVEPPDDEPVEAVEAQTVSGDRLFVHSTLDNGLQVSILSDPRLPIVATQHWVEVGAAHEAPDERGFAHLFEHMMFSATETRPRGTYATFHTQVGGTRNAYTTRDHTTYISAVAPEHHDAVLQMEVERLQALILDADEMAIDRKIVTEELRQRTENSAFSRLYVQAGVALLGDHPYARSAIGTKEDIAARTIEDARTFYDRYYRPDHIHLVVVGPVEIAPTLRRIEDLYGALEADGESMPSVTALPDVDWPPSIELRDRIPPVKATGVVFPLPPMDHADHFPLRMMLAMLVGSEIDQFSEELVTRRGKALDAGTYSERYRQGGALVFGSASLPTRRVKRAMALVDETLATLDQLAWNTPEALDSARRSAVVAEHYSVFSAERAASRIGRAELMLGDVQLAFSTPEALAEVTTDDVARVWRTWVMNAEPTRVVVRRGKVQAQ